MKKGFNEQKTATEKRDQIEPVLETLDVLAEGAERKGTLQIYSQNLQLYRVSGLNLPLRPFK